MDQSELIGEVAVSNNGRWFLSTHAGDTANLWDVSTGTIINSFPLNAQNLIFSSDDRRFAGITSSNSVHVWETDSGVETRRLLHNDDVSGIYYHSSGEHLLTWDEKGFIRLWRISNGMEIMRVYHFDVGGAVLSADSNQIHSWGMDGSQKTWRLSSQLDWPVQCLPLEAQVLTGKKLLPTGATEFLEATAWYELKDRYEQLQRTSSQQEVLDLCHSH